MEGEHLLDSQGSVQVVINNVDNLTLRGHSNTDIIISCSSNTHGLVFNNSNNINIYGITITGCGQQDIMPLSLTNIASVYIHHVTLYGNILYNNSEIGGALYMFCDTNITIDNVAFTNNTVSGNGGGLVISSHNDTCSDITITDSTFISNTVGGWGGELLIYTGNRTCNNITITNGTFTNNIITVDGWGGQLFIDTGIGTFNNIVVTNSTFTSNIVCRWGGGLYIYTHIDTYNNITVINSTFTNNTIDNWGGGLVIHNELHTWNNITITNSVFTSNMIHKWGGGLYIDTHSDTYNSVTITNSVFTNNIIAGNGGGGLVIGTDFDTSVHNNINIANSVCTNNTVVDGHGGGLYIGSGFDTYNNITITNSAFTNNAAHRSGGGIIIIALTGTHNSITINHSIFTSNTVAEGGGLVIVTYSSNYVHNNITITDSSFINNTADSGGGLIIYTGTDTLNNIAIINSAFTSNTVAEGGGLVILPDTATNNDITITNSTFVNNYGSGIFAINQVTVIFTEGHSIVANNSSPTDGGGVFLGEDCYLTTSNGGHVSFINNTAKRYGGAIYLTESFYTLLRYSQSFHEYMHYSGQCTAYNLSATFINNSAARAGDQLYGGVFIFCHGYQYNVTTYIHDLINCINVPDTVKNGDSVHHSLSQVSSDSLVICPCINSTIDCDTTSIDKMIYPGQIFSVSLVTVGLCGGASPGVVVVEYGQRLYLTSTTGHTANSCTTFNYTVKMIADVSHATIGLNVPDGDIYNIRPIDVNLTMLPCPPGLVVNFILGHCVCNDDITHISGVTCNISWMPYPIQRPGNNWIYRYDNYNCTIAHVGCPFDYCQKSYVKFSLNESDLQCNYNRSGILCGQCINGLSLMIGSNRCANCTDTTLVSVSIIIIAAVAGIILVILLIVLNLTVSVGSVNGLLFYANLVKLNESVFFSSGNIPVITQFISWCNLDMGLEYCFIDGLDGYVKTWLQFAFPLYLWFLVMVIIVGSRYSGRLSRLCGQNVIPVLATLILMSYTKFSCTVTNALMMNTIQCGEYKWSVWNVDGNIDYLGGKHIVLFIVSLFFLVVGLVYTGLVFSSQWLQYYSGKCCKRSTRDPVVRLKPLIEAYTGPFKDKYRFWTGLCLIVRLVFTVVFSFTTVLQSKLNNYIILLTVGAMIVFIAVSGRVYKDKRLTVLEMLSYINIVCLCVMTILFTDGYSHVAPVNVVVSVSVSIEMLLFVIIVTVHCSLALKVCPNSKCYNVPSTDGIRIPLVADDREKEYRACAIAHREELIFDRSSSY